jgi:ligand-binding SRPBCC domain-containing protein
MAWTRTYVLSRKQFLPITLEHAWEFFSTPRNLAEITPPDMGFEIIQPFNDEPMHQGQKISYRVRPVLGIPVKWTTLIGAVKPMESFVDTQLKGPYRKWEHTHTFRSVDGGVDMEDHVLYQLPFGPLGSLLHWLFIHRRLEQIFNYRVQTLNLIFGL